MSERGAIFLFGAQKGGVGKTTCATNFSTALAKKGFDVVLVDCDPQSNSSNWAERRSARIMEGQDIPKVNCVKLSGDIRPGIADLASRYDAVVIDPAGRDSRELRYALMCCDVAYIPCQPSAFDLETLDAVRTILEDTHMFNPERVVRSFITMAPTNPSVQDAKDAKEFMKDFEDVMPLSSRVTRNRTAYKRSTIDGSSVIESTDSKAKAEIDLLCQEILGLVTATEGEPA